MRRASKAEECLAAALEADPLPGWDLTREFQFDPVRKWRFDFAFPSQRVAVEVDGENHRRAFKMVRSDYEKLNEAVRQGWRVLRFQASTGNPTKAREWAALIREILCCRPSTSNDSDASE
jgi:very-short-patch-repair endonuclease